VLDLPVQHQTWNVTLDELPVIGPASAASISSMLGCPLQWTLSTWAGLDSEGTELPATHLLSGTLGHRLIEELHVAGAFEHAEVKFKARAELLVDGLIAREGAVLLRPGKAHERDQLRKQLVDAACALRRTLADNALQLVGAEQAFETPWRATTLRGRWDLLVRDQSGRHIVIDLKWGDTKYRTKLRKADDVQLPAYEHALRSEHAEAAAVYFSLASRKLFGLADPALPELEVVQGPGLAHTWQRVERTVEIVEKELRTGRIHVTGVHRSLPLLDSLGVPREQHPHHFSLTPEQACEYCNFDVLCGQRWAGAQ
jgi:RecB family exonuclease